MALSTGIPLRTVIVALTLFALVPTGSRAQEPTLAFPTEIEQVTVDVVVVDEEGPVTDLTVEDLEIYENGTRQAPTSFELFELPAAPATPGPSAAPEGPDVEARVSSNAGVVETPGRTFVLFFDDVHLTSDTADQAKRAAADFVASATREGDRVTLVAPGAGIWWSTRMEAGGAGLLEMLEALQGLLHPDMQPDSLTDYEAMRVHNFRDHLILEQIQRRYRLRGVETAQQLSMGDPLAPASVMAGADPYIVGKAAWAYATVTARNQLTLRTMERSLDALTQHQGRKSLILISEGFIQDPELDEFRRILNVSRRANTAIYFLSSLGLGGPSSLDEGQAPSRMGDLAPVFSDEFQNSGGSVSLAQDSGGFIMRDSREFATGLGQIADENRAYYLVGYNPTNTSRDGELREIEVRVPGRAGVDIRARRGYYAPSDDAASVEKSGEDVDLQRGMDSPYTLNDIGLRMTHFVREEASPGAARVSVAAEVDPEGLGFVPRGGEDVAALQFVMVAMNRDGGQNVRYTQKVDLKLTPEMRSELTRTWLPIVRDFELEAGSYRAKIVLKDLATGRLGTVTHDFKVPEIDPLRFRVSTPVLSDTRAPAEAGQPGERLALIARREFAPESALFCHFEVFGAARIEGSGRSRVTLDYEVRRSDGALYTRQGPSPVEPASDGSVSPMIGFPLRAAPPGDYAITMRVKDGLTGRTLDLRESFSVTGPTTPTEPVEE